jgi:hypothetical protein
MVISGPAYFHTCETCGHTWVNGSETGSCFPCEETDFLVQEIKNHGLEIITVTRLEDGQIELSTPLGIVYLEIRNRNNYKIRHEYQGTWQGANLRLLGFEVKKLISSLTSDKLKKEPSYKIKESPSWVARYG